MAGKKNALNLCLTVITSRIIIGSFSHGNAGRDGDLWGGTGASVAWLTWPCARAGSVQGFPPGQYGPGVLDEHAGRPGTRWQQSASAAATVEPNADKATSFSPGKPNSGTGGNDKAPAGRGD